MIRVGIGGWTFPPWRGVFYPPGLPQARELEYASRHVTAIEINGTFYRTQTPASFRKWASETPDDFVFTLKAPRFLVNRQVLAEAGPFMPKFFESGITELGPKLGPILWQLAPTKRFDEADLAGFLGLLPRELDGIRLRHALEVRHTSFAVPRLVELAREHGAAVVLADSETYPSIPDATADFMYLRLQRAAEELPTGYPAAALETWAARARRWSEGGAPEDLRCVAGTPPAAAKRDVFVFMINGAKVRAPAAAIAMLGRLGAT